MYNRHFLKWIVFVDFRSGLVTQIPYLLFPYSGNFWYFQGILFPEPCVLILIATSEIPCLKLIFLECPLSVVHHTNSISKVSGVLNHAYWFNLTLLNLTQNSLSETQIQAAPRIEVAICFFYGPPYIQHFNGAKSFKPFLLGRICGE